MERVPNAIEQRAIEWLVRQDAGPLSAEEQRALDDWLGADPRHCGAYIQAEANWLDIDRWAAHRRTSGAAVPAKRARRLRRWAIAAGVILLAGGAAILEHLVSRDGEVYASAIGEVRNIALADGSRLTLNTDTVATVQFADTVRAISLNRGEASFNVARDAQRPFVVRTGDAEIRALGTAFTVKISEGATDVLVTEGLVEISRLGSATPQTRRLSARQLATFNHLQSEPSVEPVKPDLIARKLAWQEGKASFAGEPLSVAVAEINRHSRLQVYVDDSELAGKGVIGVFSASDAEVFAGAVAAAFGAEVVRQPDGLHLRTNSSSRNR